MTLLMSGLGVRSSPGSRRDDNIMSPLFIFSTVEKLYKEDNSGDQKGYNKGVYVIFAYA